MKKSIALILSIILLVTVGVPVFANMIADPSLVLPENQWYLDSGIEYSHEIEMSINHPGDRVQYYVEDLYTFHSARKFKDFNITGEGSKAFGTDKTEWTILQNGDDCQATIQLYRISPKGGFSKEEPKTDYNATGEILFEDDSKYTFPMVLTITDDVVAKFTEESGHAALFQIGPNEVGIRLHGWEASTEGLSASWEVDDNRSKPHAGFSANAADQLLELTSTDFRLENGIPTNRVKLYGYRPGFLNLDCTIFYHGKPISNDGNIEAEVEGFEAIEDDTLDDVKTELGKGNSVTIEVPEDKGLSAAQLKTLKDAANGADAQIVLKPEDNKGLELEMSFSVSDIADAAANKVFTPSFTPKIPSEAEENGFSDIADTVTWICFDYDGVPPAPMTIKMKAPDGIQTGELVKIWRYNEQTKKLEVQTTVECRDGFITFTLNHFSTYAVYPASVNPNPFSDYTPPTRPQSSGGSGGGGSSSHSSSSTPSKRILKGSALGNINVSNTTTAKTVSVTEANSAATEAADQAKASGKTKSYVRFVNPTALPKNVLDAIQKTSLQKGVGLSVYADTITNNLVTARMYVDPAACTLSNDIKTGIIAGDASIEAHFGKYFKNKLKAVKFAHQGSFGLNVGVAVSLDLRGLDTSKLVLYGYDVLTNSYTLLPDQTYFIDASGYLHFTTFNGNYVIVSEDTLQ